MKQLVSPSLLSKQKNALKFLIVFFVVLGIITIGMAVEKGTYIQLFFSLPLCLVLPVLIYKDLKRVKSISYDDTALYHRSSNRDPLKSVPFENIRSITIGNFTATFRINLFNADGAEKYIYFKFPDLWNPYATNKKLAQIYELREAIDACKRRADEDFQGETQIVRLAEV